MPLQPKSKSLIFLNLAVLLWGGTALFSKTIGLPVTHIIFSRSLVAAVALGVFMALRGNAFRVRGRGDFLVLVGIGWLLGAHWLTYFHSMQTSTVAVGIIALHTYPVMTTLLEPWFFRESFQVSELFLALLVLVGILILLPGFSLDLAVTQGVLWGVLSALFFTIRNLISRKFVRDYTSSLLMFYQTAVITISLAPVLWLQSRSYAPRDSFQLFVLGVMFTALPQTLFTASFLHLKARTVSIIATLLPVYGTVFAAVLLGEIPSWRTAAGGSIVVTAVALETWRNLRKSPAKEKSSSRNDRSPR